MANALSKIRARAKAIKKRHPGRKYQSALKQAGLEYRQGKLKTRRRKPAKKRIKARRRKVGGFRPTSGAIVVRREQVARTRSAVGSHKKRRRRSAPKRARRRVGQSNGNGGGGSSSLMPLVVLGGLGLIAYAVFKNQGTSGQTSSSQLVSTGNAYRDQTAERILAWAAAGGLAADAIIKLIQALNQSDATTVNQVADSIDSGSGLPEWFIGSGYV